jgi:hypothetical protein
MSTRADPLASLAQFEPKPGTDRKHKPEPEAIEKLANEHGFTSRPTAPARTVAPVERSKRRFKTGRNVQINIKGEQDTKDELYRIADDIDQPLGETLKRALAALQRELDTERNT